MRIPLIIFIFCLLIASVSCSSRTNSTTETSGTISGTIRLHSSVSAVSFSPEKTKVTAYPKEFSAYCSSTKAFLISGIKTANYYLIAENSHYKARMTNVSVPKGQSVNVSEVILEPQSTITGTILYPETLFPSPIFIKLSNYGDFTADSFGRFSISSVPTRVYQATVSGANYTSILIPEVRVKPSVTTALPAFYISPSNAQSSEG